MAVVFDSSLLIDLLNPKLKGDRRIRIDHLLGALQKQRTKILIPAPVLAELMIHAGKARDDYHQYLNSSTILPDSSL